MARFLLYHRHAADECGVAFAAWRGHDSPLRHRETLGTCRLGGHEIWWLVDAPSAQDALGQLPYFVAQRTAAAEVSSIAIP
ncbi:MAG TPA: hypothetical protein VFG42_01110 [Baekduia sp.]|uniref:hypothetical protein n=1 Tax=Baekduia sp. TaxID=2600305 RepID=UPI002D78BAB9|nr:hypothetical protein [Baekduia sp.]HET6505360.1 hypothetical protein [Baekduia sp.]